MADREKVNGFELCANGEPCTGEKFMKCPFSPRNNAEQNCGVTMARYAIELQQAYYTLEHDWKMLKELLKEQPELVRCKDCKWYDERISMCDNCGLPREETFFCADGKSKQS